jgi:hypothetical protein
MLLQSFRSTEVFYSHLSVCTCSHSLIWSLQLGSKTWFVPFYRWECWNLERINQPLGYSHEVSAQANMGSFHS